MGPFFDLTIYKLSYVDEHHFRLGIEGREESYEIVKREDLADRIYSLGHCAIRDDFTSWDSHNQQRAFGKPFPIDTHPELTRLFFDDWATVNEIVSPFDAKSGAFLPFKPCWIPSTSTIDALLDDQYYISALPK